MQHRHPKGLIPAALANMGERFGYYIMNAVLVLFLCSKFGVPEEKATLIYSFFYMGIYILSLVGGIIADKSQNYKGTIQSGLIIMASGYIILSIPIMATAVNQVWLLPLTCAALFLIAFGNGLFKGNLQAIVGQMYDDYEAEAAKVSPEALNIAKSKRDSGFQIFYMFINVGGLIAPFVAPLLRSWWLGQKGLKYNAELPELCHKFINGSITAEDAVAIVPEADAATDSVNNVIAQNAQVLDTINPSDTLNVVADAQVAAQVAAEGGWSKLVALASEVGATDVAPEAMTDFCENYLNVFNTGVHYSFIASVVAMFISLVIFLIFKKGFPTPAKKVAAASVQYTPEEKKAMAKELRQRIYALSAVLVIAVFFWFSFHQNGTSMSLFARDFVNTNLFPPEVWQAVNPFFVIVLTFPIMWLFEGLAKRGKAISTPRKIAIGMGIAGIAYLIMTVFCYLQGYPSATDFKGMEAGAAAALKATPWILIVYYFFMTVAELFISPLGLSFVSKVAPKNILGLCQGLWLGATAVGNGILWIGPLLYNQFPIWIAWAVFMVVCFVPMIVMLCMVKWLEKVAC